MISYTKTNVIVISLIITTFLFSIIEFSIYSVERALRHNKESIVITNDEINLEQNELEQNTSDKETIASNVEEPKNIWTISIPAINLEAPIKEGTSQNVMSKHVGHFENTSKWDGNIGLAAHNRGVVVEHYFKNIKKLKVGDEIIYTTNEGIRKYTVVTNTIIDETDWTYLQETQDNRITLITCVENQPEYRRCVQAVQIV